MKKFHPAHSPSSSFSDFPPIVSPGVVEVLKAEVAHLKGKLSDYEKDFDEGATALKEVFKKMKAELVDLRGKLSIPVDNVDTEYPLPAQKTLPSPLGSANSRSASSIPVGSHDEKDLSRERQGSKTLTRSPSLSPIGSPLDELRTQRGTFSKFKMTAEVLTSSNPLRHHDAPTSHSDEALGKRRRGSADYADDRHHESLRTGDRHTSHNNDEQTHDDHHNHNRHSGSGAPSGQQQAKRPRVDSLNPESKKRGQRLFGVLMGHLNKFKEQSTQKSEAEIRREQLEARLQEKLRKEKEELAEKVKRDHEERRERLLTQRQEEDAKRQADMKQTWKTQRSQLSHFIRTTSKPCIYYLPAKHNDRTLQLLADSKRLHAMEDQEENQEHEEPGREGEHQERKMRDDDGEDNSSKTPGTSNDKLDEDGDTAMGDEKGTLEGAKTGETSEGGDGERRREKEENDHYRERKDSVDDVDPQRDRDREREEAGTAKERIEGDGEREKSED
ncbi:hypothetical protein HK102_001991 [Quaeritorhiza haematococci]|nr:hypothetical protein HK102_001991 [Quaeritorhiza haematococci]